MTTSFEYIYGKHPVREVIRLRPDLIAELYLHTEVVAELQPELAKLSVRVHRFDGDKTPRDISRGAVHQGYIAKINVSKLLLDEHDFLATLEVTPRTALVVLGEIQDPHNVGAIIRSAAAFGVAGVLFPKHRQAGMTGTVLKTSSGTAFSIPLIEVGNVNQTLRKLQEKGFFVYGLAGDGEVEVMVEDYRKPSVFVLGNEGGGLREKTASACDILLRIPMHPRCESLNASVSAALVLQAWSLRHPEALTA
jgi:23S rRNA (guanosine2251-2'-O)-methyltransferase